MGIEQLFDKYGFWALLLFIFIDKGAALLQKYLPYVNGQQMKKLEIIENDKQITQEHEERQTVALERIGEALTLIAERMSRLEDSDKTIMGALNETNQGLAVLLDRQTAKKQQPKQ